MKKILIIGGEKIANISGSLLFMTASIVLFPPMKIVKLCILYLALPRWGCLLFLQFLYILLCLDEFLSWDHSKPWVKYRISQENNVLKSLRKILCVLALPPHIYIYAITMRLLIVHNIYTISTHDIYNLFAQYLPTIYTQYLHHICTNIHYLHCICTISMRYLFTPRRAAVTAATAPGLGWSPLRAPPRGRPGDEMRTPRARAEATHHAGTSSANTLLR